MKFVLPFPVPRGLPHITHRDDILLLGSCFTEHISGFLNRSKFTHLANPHGILFNPLSVTSSLKAYLDKKQYSENELFEEQGVWHHWDFHSRFSHTDRRTALRQMNDSVARGAQFLDNAGWIFVTLGSAFQYFLKSESARHPELAVANCHRVPAGRFSRQLLSVATIVSQLQAVLRQIKAVRPSIRVLLTISPVRHIREGIIDNNRSKARLVDAVHEIVAANSFCHYFPAYELMIDVLRDYRFYDADMVHPNFQATKYIWEQFQQYYFNEETTELIAQLQEVEIAGRHKPRFPDSPAHQHFKSRYLEKVRLLMQQYPELDLEEEYRCFNA